MTRRWVAGLLVLSGCGGSKTSPTAPGVDMPDTGRGSFYLNGSVDGRTYTLYHESGAPLPCPERYCAWPTAVLYGGREYVFGAAWSRNDKGDSHIGLWSGGAYLGRAEGLPSKQTHPEVRRLPNGEWLMVTADWGVKGEVAPLAARLWSARAPEGPWSPSATVYMASGTGDAAGFSVDYWCEADGRWLLYMSGYPGGGGGSAMTLAEASRPEGPYSAARTIMAPGDTRLVDGLPVLKHNLSPSSIYREGGRWTMVGTGYGVEAGEWYEATFKLVGASATGPWTVTGEPAFYRPGGLASFENAEPALAGTACAAE